jgi:hypothetical protein
MFIEILRDKRILVTAQTLPVRLLNPLTIKFDRNVTSGSRNRASGMIPQVLGLLPGYLNVTF